MGGDTMGCEDMIGNKGPTEQSALLLYCAAAVCVCATQYISKAKALTKKKKQAIFLRPRSRSRVKQPSYAQLRAAVDLETAQPKTA